MPGTTLAVILAAGAGTRLRPLTDARPKCLLEVGGRPLLDYTLQALAGNGLEDILVVTGHCADQIISRYRGRVRTLHNPDYQNTNNLYSLWAARGAFAGRDFLCLHADLLFHPAMLRPCLDSDDEVTVILDREWVEETMKARVEGDRVLEVGKNLPADKVSGTFLGIARFSPAASTALPAVLDSLLADEKNRQAYFSACLPALAARGCRVGYTLTEGRPWIEIDCEDDLKRASAAILPVLLAAFSRPG